MTRSNQKQLNQNIINRTFQNTKYSSQLPENLYKTTKITSTRRLMSLQKIEENKKQYQNQTLTEQQYDQLCNRLYKTQKQPPEYPVEETFHPKIYSKNFDTTSRVQEYINTKQYQQCQKTYKKYVESDQQIKSLLSVQGKHIFKQVDLEKSRKIQQQRMQQAQEKFMETIRQQQTIKDEEDMKECTFQPKISQASREMAAGLDEDIFQRFEGYEKKKKHWIQQQQQQKLEKELESIKPYKTPQKSSSSKINIYDRLYYDSKIREMRLTKSWKPKQQDLGEAELVRSMQDSDLYERLYNTAKEQQMKIREQNLKSDEDERQHQQTYKQQQDFVTSMSQINELQNSMRQFEEVRQMAQANTKHTTKESQQICQDKIYIFLSQLYNKVNWDLSFQQIVDQIQTFTVDQELSDKIVEYLTYQPKPSQQQFINDLRRLLPKDVPLIYSKLKLL